MEQKASNVKSLAWNNVGLELKIETVGFTTRQTRHLPMGRRALGTAFEGSLKISVYQAQVSPPPERREEGHKSLIA